MNNGETTLTDPLIDFEFGEFRLSPTARRLNRVDGSLVELSPRLFDALLYFIERPGQLLSKDTLLTTLWPGLVVEDNNLNQLVLALRRALGDDAHSSRWIQTVPRRGFRFVGTVRVRTDSIAALTTSPTDVQSPQAVMRAPPATLTKSPPVARPKVNRWQASRNPLLLALAAMLAVGAVVWAGHFTASPTLTLTTLAVLPFKPLTLEGRDEVLEVGMADSLIARMGAAPGLVVRSIGSVRRFGGTEQDPLSAARELDAQWIVDGTIQRSGDRVRVTARLLKASDGTAGWNGSFDDRFVDVFDILDKISERVAQQLAPQLSSRDVKWMAASKGSRNPEAYEAYLTARFHEQGLRVDGLAKSVDLYRRAIALDPGYALAYTGIASVFRRMVIGIDAPPGTALTHGLEAAQKAVQLDPMLAEAHAALGWMRWWAQWDWPGAEQSFRRALALNANVPEALLGLGHFLCSQQRCDEGLALVQRARALDPLSLITNVIEASYLLQRSGLQESRTRLDKALQIESRFWPAHQLLAGLHISARRPDDAVEALRKAQSLTEHSVQPTSNLGAVLAKNGQPEQARQVLATLLVWAEQRYVPPVMIASLYCALGNHEPALKWLEKAQQVRDINLLFLSVCSIELKDEPRFNALRLSLKLPPWRDGDCAPLQAPTIACPP